MRMFDFGREENGAGAARYQMRYQRRYQRRYHPVIKRYQRVINALSIFGRYQVSSSS